MTSMQMKRVKSGLLVGTASTLNQPGVKDPILEEPMPWWSERPAIRRSHSKAARPPIDRTSRLGAAVFAALILIATGTTAHAASITVSTLSDPTGSAGTCSLHDAITAANTKVATNNCVAGTGTDTIDFSVTGTITLANTLPAIKNTLTIDGSGQAITISGNNFVQPMVVNTGANLTLQFLTLTERISRSQTGNSEGGAVLNNGTLTIADATISNCTAAGAVFRDNAQRRGRRHLQRGNFDCLR